VNLTQPVALLGAPVGVYVLLQVVAPVETLRFPVAMERVLPLLLALLSGTIGNAAIESLDVDPHRLAAQEVVVEGSRFFAGSQYALTTPDKAIAWPMTQKLPTVISGSDRLLDRLRYRRREQQRRR
jgi:hypothetical protein